MSQAVIHWGRNDGSVANVDAAVTFCELDADRGDGPAQPSETLEARLLDLDDGRLQAMDDGGVDLQILSLAAAGQEALEPADATAQCALDVLGVDRVLYSADYPYRANTAGAELLRTAPIAPGDLRKVAAGNAERVLDLPRG